MARIFISRDRESDWRAPLYNNSGDGETHGARQTMAGADVAVRQRTEVSRRRRTPETGEADRQADRRAREGHGVQGADDRHPRLSRRAGRRSHREDRSLSEETHPMMNR